MIPLPLRLYSDIIANSLLSSWSRMQIAHSHRLLPGEVMMGGGSARGKPIAQEFPGLPVNRSVSQYISQFAVWWLVSQTFSQIVSSYRFQFDGKFDEYSLVCNILCKFCLLKQFIDLARGKEVCLYCVH